MTLAAGQRPGELLVEEAGNGADYTAPAFQELRPVIPIRWLRFEFVIYEDCSILRPWMFMLVGSVIIPLKSTQMMGSRPMQHIQDF